MKKFLAVIAGIVVASIIISIGSILSFKSFSTAPIEVFDLSSIRRLVGGLSTVGLLLIILSHAVGSLAGGVTVGRILKADTMNVGLTLGAILTILGIVNMISIPTYPEWFYIDFLVFIPLSMFGANYTSKL